MLKPIRLCIFDVAGTTVSECGIVREALSKSLKRFGISVEPSEIIPFQGSSKLEIIRKFVRAKGRDQPREFSDAIHSHFRNSLILQYQTDERISLIDEDLFELFGSLRASGKKVCLSSGFSDDIFCAIAHRLHLKDHIDGYVTSDKVLKGRPAPDMVRYLMRQQGITDPREVCKVGDTLNDVLEGVAAKCGLVVGVLSGAFDEEYKKGLALEMKEHGAHEVLDSVMGLSKLLSDGEDLH